MVIDCPGCELRDHGHALSIVASGNENQGPSTNTGNYRLIEISLHIIIDLRSTYILTRYFLFIFRAIMGIEPPFVYEHPAKYSFYGPTDKAFNPRAASQATWSPPRPRPKPRDGPLIDSVGIDRHPDSYFVVFV